MPLVVTWGLAAPLLSCAPPPPPPPLAPRQSAAQGPHLPQLHLTFWVDQTRVSRSRGQGVHWGVQSAQASSACGLPLLRTRSSEAIKFQRRTAVLSPRLVKPQAGTKGGNMSWSSLGACKGQGDSSGTAAPQQGHRLGGGPVDTPGSGQRALSWRARQRGAAAPPAHFRLDHLHGLITIVSWP